MTENIIQTVRVKKIINECEGIKTIQFNLKEIIVLNCKLAFGILKRFFDVF